jgi:hypothetical protein
MDNENEENFVFSFCLDAKGTKSQGWQTHFGNFTKNLRCRVLIVSVAFNKLCQDAEIIIFMSYGKLDCRNRIPVGRFVFSKFHEILLYAKVQPAAFPL